MKTKTNEKIELYIITNESFENVGKNKLEFLEFRCFITTETLHVNDEKWETLWKIRGHIKKEIDDAKSSENLRISDLSEIIYQVPNDLKIRIKYPNGKIITIDDIQFLEYGCIFEKDHTEIEHIDFIGYMNPRNRYAYSQKSFYSDKNVKSFKEKRKEILERIEKIRDEVEMLNRALNQKTAEYYVREDEKLICEVGGRTISGEVAYFLLGDGLHINGVFCDECENGRVE